MTQFRLPDLPFWFLISETASSCGGNDCHQTAICTRKLSHILIPGRISNGSHKCAQVCNSELDFLLFFEQHVYFDVTSIRLTFFALHII